MSLLLFALESLQAAVATIRWVIHNGAWCAAAAVAIFAAWLAWKLPADDPPPLTTADDDGPAPPARLSDDQITAAMNRFDWDAAKADLYTDPADTEPNP